MKADSGGKKSTRSDRDAELLQLHIAEYQALTSRATSWILLQFGLLPVGLTATLFYIQILLDGRSNEIIIWTSLFILQLIALVWSQTMLEQYAIVRYVECYLKPDIRRDLDDDPFWCFEEYLVSHRGLGIGWGLFFIPGLSVLAVLTAAILRTTIFSVENLVGVGVNLLLTAVLWYNGVTANRIRREWETFMRGQVDGGCKRSINASDASLERVQRSRLKRKSKKDFST